MGRHLHRVVRAARHIAGYAHAAVAERSQAVSAKELIQHYIDEGMHLVRIDPTQKTPKDAGWPTRPVTVADAFLAADGALQCNVGIATGSVSGNLVCVDLDHIPTDLADAHLPPTAATEGRPSAPRTHRWYRITDNEWKDDELPKSGTQVRRAMDADSIPRFAGGRRWDCGICNDGKKRGIDLQAAGRQVVVPPSRHPSGEVRAWDDPLAKAEEVSWHHLVASCEALARAVGWTGRSRKGGSVQLRSTPAAGPTDTLTMKENSNPFPVADALPADVERARAALQRLGPAIEGQGGHHRTFLACATLGDYALSETQAWSLIDDWNRTCLPPWGAGDLRATLRNAYLRRGAPMGIKSTSFPPAEPADDRVMQGTDIALGRHFARDHSGNARFAIDVGHWLVWDGKRWTEDAHAVGVTRWAKETARRLRIEAAECEDEHARKAAQAFAKRASSANGIAAMLTMAKSEPNLAVKLGDFDGPDLRYLLHVENGVLDLRTGVLLPHDPQRFCTKLAPVRYDPDATHPAIDRVLSHLTNDDPAVRDCLERCLAMAACGDTSAKVMLCLIGAGDSGKGVLITAMLACLGDYATMASVDLFAGRDDSAGRATPEVAALRGLRFAAINETADGAGLNGDKLKRLVGGDERITARALYGAPVTFQMQATLCVASNHDPWLPVDDEASWKRLLLFRPERSVPPGERDPALKNALQYDTQARSALLAMLTRAATRWMRDGGGYRGLAIPACMEASRGEWRARVDPLTPFLDERCVFGHGHTVGQGEFGRAYADWCRDTGTKILSHRARGSVLRQRGLQEAKQPGGKRVWQGIALRAHQPAGFQAPWDQNGGNEPP
jgi:putative DNA primase/helicase